MLVLLKCLKWILIIAVVSAIGIFIFLNFHSVFGGKPDQTSLERIRNSPNFNGTEFVNLEPTVIATRDDNPSLWEWALKRLNPPKGKSPSQPLPTEPLNVNELKHGSIVWLGHATTLMQIGDKRIITDPVFYYASPLPFTVEPFAMSHTPKTDELPKLDAVLISHDHYDHLDYRAIREIDRKTARFIVPLGVKAHLQKWGVADEKITELDWDETAQIGDIAVTLVPSRHFSGRTMGGRNHTLWGGYVMKGAGLSYYFSGDSGYGRHYKERIAQYGPFDLVLMESGAYDEGWSQIHSFPEQSVRAVADVGANRTMPVHWGKFDLANHSWTDGIKRFTKAAEENGITTVTPKIGQTFNVLHNVLPQEKWWESVE